MEIYVLDTETTSLHKDGYIVEISIVKVDTEKKSIQLIYDEVVGYDVSKWKNRNKKAWIFENSTLTLDDVENGHPIAIAVKEVREILEGKIPVTSYNAAFDFREFLFNKPWYINNDHLELGTTRNRLFKKGDLQLEHILDFHLAPCIMESALMPCGIEHHYYGMKYPSLEEANSILGVYEKEFDMDDVLKDMSIDKRHRALYDCVEAAKVLLTLVERGEYELDGIKERINIM